MLSFDTTKSFQKQFKKLSKNVHDQFEARLRLFLIEPDNRQLNIHPLTGKYQGYYSINITGDMRALYRWQGSTLVIFAFIGIHSQLHYSQAGLE